MFLYAKKNASFDIYQMTERENDAKDFRKSEMVRADLDDKIYYSRTWTDSGYFNNYSKEQVENSILSEYYFDNYMDSHIFVYSNSIKRFFEEFFSRYYNGEYKENLIARFQTSQGIRNFLLTEDCYVRDGKTLKYLMDHIIELPNSLYILQLLERGKFDQFGNHDITRQLELFDIHKIDEISFNELQEPSSDGAVSDTYAELVDKAKSNARILQLVKKK